MTGRGEDYAAMYRAELDRLGWTLASRVVRVADRSATLTDRQLFNLLRRVGEPNDAGCREWRGSRGGQKYANWNAASQGTRLGIKAHRAVYQILIGPIPDRLTLDHTCFNTMCVNPKHLDPCTIGENTGRSPRVPSSINRAKDACPRGHPYDSVTRQRGGTGIRRNCLTCQRAAKSLRRARLRGEWERGERQLPAVKRCGRCGVVKSASDFDRSFGDPSGLCGVCRSCGAAYSRGRRRKDVDNG